jgi:hypothetical protein
MATPHPYRGLTLSLQAKQHGEALNCLHNANHMRKQRTVNPSKGNTPLFLEFSHNFGPGKRSKALAAEAACRWALRPVREIIWILRVLGCTTLAT